MLKSKASPTQRVNSEIPRRLDLERGVVISFYQVSILNGEPYSANGRITHGNYINARIIKDKKPLCNLEASDMKLLFYVKREYYRKENS